MSRELCALDRIYDPIVRVFVKELEMSKSMRMDQHWREMLKKDYTHKIFTTEKLTKKKKIQMEDEMEDEDDIDEMVEMAFGSDEEKNM